MRRWGVLMAFIRGDLSNSVNEVLTDDDEDAILAIKDSVIVPSFCYEKPSQVPIHFFGDISGLTAIVQPLVSQILADTEGDRSCELLSMATSPDETPFKALPFKANAAY